MPRTAKEWIGKTDDTPVPPRVKLRVFEKHHGRCHISGIKIRPGDDWQCDHVIALIEGGENREANLAPALVEHHKEKTADEVGRKAKVDRIRKKHLGIWQSKTPMQGSKSSRWKKPFNKPAERR